MSPDDINTTIVVGIRCRTWGVLVVDYHAGLDGWYKDSGKPWWVPRFLWSSPNGFEIMDYALRAARYRQTFDPAWENLYQSELARLTPAR